MLIIGTEKIEEILIVVLGVVLVLVMAEQVIVEMILIDVEEEEEEAPEGRIIQIVTHSSSGVGMNHINEGQVVTTDSVTIVVVLRQSFLGSRLAVLGKKPTLYLPLTSLL